MSDLLRRLTSLTVLTPILIVHVNAVPNPYQPRDILQKFLSPQLANDYVDCSDDQKTRLTVAFADAAKLARIALDVDPSSTAFTHYLRPEDESQAKSLWSMIAANNDPTSAPYTFSVRCAKNDDTDCKGARGGRSLAYTDSQPHDGTHAREIKICPLFFTAAETSNNLDSRKYEGDKRGSWCQTGQRFKDFETAGHTALHEMTHLDSLGQAAGMPPRANVYSIKEDGVVTHGTDDVDGFGDDYVVAARALKDTWVDNRDDLAEGALQPFQNAENIAAAATEWWFIKLCGFTEIDL